MPLKVNIREIHILCKFLSIVWCEKLNCHGVAFYYILYSVIEAGGNSILKYSRQSSLEYNLPCPWTPSTHFNATRTNRAINNISNNSSKFNITH